MISRTMNRFYKALSNSYTFGIITFFALGLTFFVLFPVRVSKVTHKNIAESLEIVPTDVIRDAIVTSKPLPLIVETEVMPVQRRQITTSPSFPDADDIVSKRFLSRNEHIKKACQRFLGTSRNSFHQFKKLETFADGLFKWCRVLKVASSFISQLKEKVSLETANIFPGISRVQTFMMVREPYSRLVSGYIDRILTFPPSWERYGTKIIETFRPNATAQEMRCGHDVTFPEFIKYFIRSQKSGWMKNYHFAPTSEACNPCKISFNFICHLETLKEDFSFILNSVNITSNLDLGISPGLFKAKVRKLIILNQTVTRCQTMCGAFQTLWWAFKSRGFLPRELPFPLSEADCEKDLAENVFGDLCWETYQKYDGKFDKHEEIRKTIVELFLQVPLEDRIQVRNLLATDFELFGYEAQPDDIFPELVRKKSSFDSSRG